MAGYKDVLRAHGAQFSDEGRVLDFGDTTGEYRAVATPRRAGLTPLMSVTPLRLTGTDRLDSLHGQITNEVKRLEPGQTNLALMLNIKGHALAQMWIYRRRDDLFVAVEGGRGPQVMKQLKAHIIFDQVEIQDLTGTISTLTLQGKAAGRLVQEVLGEVPPQGAFVQLPFAGAEVLISPTRRSEGGGLDLHVLTKDAGDLFDTLVKAGVTPAGEDALDIARVSAGLPAAETEGGEGVLPQEAGLEHAESYRKGCYLGQEIMARIEARGKLRRELRGLRLGEWPDGREVAQNGKKVGRLGKPVRHPDLGIIALAVVRNDLEGEELEVDGIEATLVSLPFEAERVAGKA